MLTDINPYIRVAWYSTLKPNEYIRTRVIFDYELLLIKDGYCTVSIEDRVYHPEPGDIFLLRPGIPHSIRVSADMKVVQPHIHFDLHHYSDSEIVPVSYSDFSQITAEQASFFRPDELGILLDPCPDFIRSNNPKAIEALLVNVIFTYNNRSTYLDEIHWRSLFMELLYSVLYEMQFSPTRRTSTKGENIQRVKLYLDHNLHRNVSLDELVANCYLSKCYMVSAFKKVYGVSPYLYHQRQRINEAKNLIRFTSSTMTEIAMYMGFSSLHAFSSLFRRLEHMSPLEYRHLTKLQDVDVPDSPNT